MPSEPLSRTPSHRLAHALGRWALLALCGGLAACSAVVPSTGPRPAGTPSEADLRHLDFLGQAVVPPETAVEGLPVGGLSALTYDAEKRVYYALSDDRSEHGPARFYTLAIDLGEGHLEGGNVRVTAVTVLRNEDGEPFPRGGIDPEGLAFDPRSRTLYLSSEGAAARGLAPFVRQVGLDGKFLRNLPLPRAFLPTPDGASGVRDNLAFESLALTPDGAFLFTGTENALAQDGPAADVGLGSPSRLLRFDLRRGVPDEEAVYPVEPVSRPPVPATAFRVNGLVELLALDDEHLLALEREFVPGVGNRLRLYAVSLEGATDVAGVERLSALPPGTLHPVAKRLVLDLARVAGGHLALQNTEGMTFGPRLPDGRRTLVLVSDDNFDPPRETTQLLAFALGGRGAVRHP